VINSNLDKTKSRGQKEVEREKKQKLKGKNVGLYVWKVVTVWLAGPIDGYERQWEAKPKIVSQHVSTHCSGASIQTHATIVRPRIEVETIVGDRAGKNDDSIQKFQPFRRPLSNSGSSTYLIHLIFS